jgi:hypothetical protein
VAQVWGNFLISYYHQMVVTRDMHSGGSSEVRAEEVVLWQAECEELLRILQERNRTCLPPSLAHFGGMPLSFLYH